MKKMDHKGFTLIEIIVLIVMAGILLPAIIVPFATGVKNSGKPEVTTTAMYLAHQKMEEFMKYNYSKAVLAPRTLAWHGDMDPNFPNYQWADEVLYVPSNDINAAGSASPPDTGYKRVLVRVRDPQNDTYEVYSVVTNFP